MKDLKDLTCCQVCGIQLLTRKTSRDEVGWVCVPCYDILVKDYKAPFTCNCTWEGSDYRCFGTHDRDSDKQLKVQEAVQKMRLDICPQCGKKH